MTAAAHPLDDVVTSIVAAQVEAYGARLARPIYVTQRTCLTVVGMPARAFLAAARAGRFESRKEHRLVYARTDDVVAYVDSLRRELPERADVADDEAAALARVGARMTH